MSQTMVVHPIVGALLKAEDILGRDREWHEINPEQAAFLKRVFATKKELSSFSEKELRSWASYVASELNAILRKEGFDIQLDEFADGEFGVVSILDVIVEWLMKGEESQLYVGKKDYPAVRLEPTAEVEGRPKRVFEVFTSTKHSQPIALVHTKTGDRVYMTIADKPRQGFDLMARVDEIRKTMQPSRGRFLFFLFPMVDLNQMVDISWLKGMQTISQSGRVYYISQAKQQTKLKMNELGARVKSAVAITVRTVSIMPDEPIPLIIDKPFYLWIERAGVTLPIMYAYLDEVNWKNPGDLSNM